jgi:serine/threonine-protein kinase
MRPGALEDRYRALFLVGRGGMGTVEVALERSADGFERVVALKRLLPEQARDPRHKEMFLREARLAALLKHPNVVHAFAFGELYGELFLAMEYVEGETLARLLASARGAGGLVPAVTAFVLAQVCDGLHAAHELRDRGGQPLHVVHRDVSPQNVMIAHDGHVKILDFGVAKFETGGHETRTGEVKGKMAYMSPEQALGEKLDRRSDLFSVGAVLFECLTGGRMWGDGTDLEVMRRLALEAPPRLDAAMPDAPAALVALHARLVAHDVAERPATAKDVADELRAFVAAGAHCDRAGVQALMREAFAAEATRQRDRLNEALRQAAPTKVESLRKTLDPTRSFEMPTRTEPVILQSEPPLASARHVARGARSRWPVIVGGGVALVAVAIGSAAVATRLNARDAATNVANAPQSLSASSFAPVPVPVPASTTPPAVTLAPSPTIATPSTLPASPTPTHAPALSPSPSHLRPHPPRASSRPTGTTKLPDVDPTPF